MKQIQLTILALLLVVNNALGHPRYKFRVRFTDKSKTEYTLDKPQEYLSERALDRRNRQGIEIDSTDLPVCSEYVKIIASEKGVKPLLTSKWNNTLVIETDDSLVCGRLLRHPFVKEVKKVYIDNPDAHFPRSEDRKKVLKNELHKTECIYGVGEAQIRLHNGDSLHAAGYRGQGMHVAIIDAGFYNADVVKLLKGATVLGTRDFVDPESDIYAEHDHGLKVFSCMAANKEHIMIGTAPEASYWLLRSEDNDTENLVEEDYWAAAIEFADSVGVDVVNSSLGYYNFDDCSDNYCYHDLDGKTSLMSLSAAKAVEKGMLVVVSAGNSGMDSWKKITPPADAFGVIAVGAVDSQGMNTSFSSIGNTYDGRTKPDVMSLGEKVSVAYDDGCLIHCNGTSFSSPIFCGLAACLWQACPRLTVLELIDLIHESGNNAEYPDNINGYGIPDVWKAYKLTDVGNYAQED